MIFESFNTGFRGCVVTSGSADQWFYCGEISAAVGY